MKKKITVAFLIFCILSLCAVCLASCNFVFLECDYYGKHKFQNTPSELYICQDATCTQPAKYYKSCACGAISNATFEYGEALGHDYIQRVISPEYKFADVECLSGAQYFYSCICGDRGAETFEAGEGTGHNFEGCEFKSYGDGTHFRTCSVCNQYEMESCGGGEPATCTTLSVCASCGKEYGELKRHTFSREIVSPEYLFSDVTCTQPAKYYKSCICGEKGAEVFEDGEPMHNAIIKDEEVAARFGSAGYTEGYHCEACGDVLVEQTEIPALLSNYACNQDYYDYVNGVEIGTVSYSLTLNEDNVFRMSVLRSVWNETPIIEYVSGELQYIGGRIYELAADGLSKPMYVTFDNNKFGFCNRDGSQWDKLKYDRLAGDADIDIVPRAGNGVYGYYDFINCPNGEAMQSLYFRLYTSCEAFIGNNEDISATAEGDYVVDSIDIGGYELSIAEAVSVWKVFYLENPRYYWLANSLTIVGTVFPVCIDVEYASAQVRRDCDDRIDAVADAFLSLVSDDMTEFEIAIAAHDFIVEGMDYSYQSDGVTPNDAIWAHNIIGFLNGLGVCETYAKMYMYLCCISGLECMIVTGQASGEYHAWNVVNIDGDWYGVDCTWDDDGEDGFGYYFFGMSDYMLSITRTADSAYASELDYLYELPVISGRSLEMVSLSRNGEESEICRSIDEAFEKMTDRNGDYTIILLCKQLGRYNIESTRSPFVKSLTIKADIIELSEMSYYLIDICLSGYLYLNSDLTVYDISVNGNGVLKIGNNRLTTQGRHCIFNVDVCGVVNEKYSSEIEAFAETSTVFYKELKVHSVKYKNQGGDITLYGNTYIEEIDTTCLRIWYVCKVVIGNFYSTAGHAWIDVEDGADLVIKNIYIEDKGIIERFSIYRRFVSQEEFGTVTIGKSNCVIDFTLCGNIRYYYEDENGDMVFGYEGSIDPFDITLPIATLLDVSLYHRFKVGLSPDGYWEDVTLMYQVNSEGEIVLKSEQQN